MVFCHCSRRMTAVQRARRTKESVWYWECPSCKGRIRDDRLQTEVVGALDRELLRPGRLAALERHQEALLRSRRKETLRTRTRLETRLANVKSDQHAQLRSVAAGIDPVPVREVVEELQRDERLGPSCESQSVQARQPGPSRRSGGCGSMPVTSEQC
jgi:hypothetical protein